MPNSDDLYEQKRLRKNTSGRSKHVDMQQRCSLLNNKLKEIEGVDDLESMDPRELSSVPDVVISPKFKMPNVDITRELRASYRELYGFQRQVSILDRCRSDQI